MLSKKVADGNIAANNIFFYSIDLKCPHPPHKHNTVVHQVICCAQQYSCPAEHKEAHSSLNGTVVKSCLFMELLGHVKSCHLTVPSTGLKSGLTMFISSWNSRKLQHRILAF